MLFTTYYILYYNILHYTIIRGPGNCRMVPIMGCAVERLLAARALELRSHGAVTQV